MDNEYKQALKDRAWWALFEHGDWVLKSFTERDSASFCNNKTQRTVQVTGDYISFFSGLGDDTWKKHKSAEEPGDLYWNEVTGIGSMQDQYRISELEDRIFELEATVLGFNTMLGESQN